MLNSMKNHLTDVCDHDEKSWCQHCEEGCEWCGSLDGVGDDMKCEECSLNSSIMAAEIAFEGDR